jgi:hypothetical protein
MPMPAVTFRKSTAHRNQNCGVRIASFAVASCGAGACVFAAPGGFHPGGGNRTVMTPNIMNAKYSTPSATNVSATPLELAEAKCCMSRCDSGEPIIAPPPKPMIAIPVAMPGRSGNHLMSVDTGEMYPNPRPMPPSTP